MPDNDSDGAKIWEGRYRSGKTVAANVNVIGDPMDYTTHPFLWREAVARRLTGSRDGDPNLLIGQTYLTPPADKMLALGSGLASVEEWFVLCNFVNTCVAFEISPAAVGRARERIAAAGLSDRLEVRAGDARSAGLEAGSFDVVLVQAAIHHFLEIDEMYEFMHRMLRPGGLLIFDEYVGPDRLILDDQTLEEMEKVHACLAENFRRSISSGEVQERILRPTVEQMLEMDPSEGVHSSRILPLTYQYFDVLERRDYGGTILRPMLTGLLGHFDFEHSKDQTIARLIVLLEDTLLRTSLIPNCHTRIVARRRNVSRPPFSAEESRRMVYADWVPPKD